MPDRFVDTYQCCFELLYIVQIETVFTLATLSLYNLIYIKHTNHFLFVTNHHHLTIPLLKTELRAVGGEMGVGDVNLPSVKAKLRK